MDAALALADWDGFAGRRAETEARGRLRGRGIACYLESAALSNERMEIRFDASGSVTVVAGTFSHGQGHETVYAQMVSDWLGVDFTSVRLVQGDTDAVSIGRGTYGSRSMTVGGSALRIAADKVIEKGPGDRRLAAGGRAGRYRIRRRRLHGDRNRPNGRHRRRGEGGLCPVRLPGGARARAGGHRRLRGGRGNFPNGCQIAEVEIDPETGAVDSSGSRRSTMSAGRSTRCCLPGRSMAASRRARARH